MAMGGRIAEELVFDEMTTGAANDIERATELARAMVCGWGMSSKLGPLAFGGREGEVFLGRDFYDPARLLRGDGAADRRRGARDRHRAATRGPRSSSRRTSRRSTASPTRLIEYETLEADDVETLVKGGTMTRDRPKPRVNAPPKLEKKEKRKILDALEPLPALEPHKA